jgi:hypothetical protein
MSIPSIVHAPALASSQPPDWRSQPVAECIARLTALFAFQRELMRTEAAWIAGVRYWDAKLMMAEHLLEDARMAEAILKRLHELKASSAEHKQVAGVEELVRTLAGARSGDEWLRGLYLKVKPWLIGRCDDYLGMSDPVMDAPSHEVVLRIKRDLEAQISWFRSFSPVYSPWEQPDTAEWESYVQSLLGSTAVLGPSLTPGSANPSRPVGCTEFRGISQVRRDSTFRIADKSEYPREGATFVEKRFLVFYNHTQEMQFAESLGAILYETAEMPWAFHHDLARHMADEVRHAKMGQTRLAQLGIRLSDVPMLTQHYGFRSNMNPLERFCLMTLVMEATAFERKRAHVELFNAHGDVVSALYESYDIRDEMLHTNLGHVWVPILLRVYHDSRSVSELVQHCRGLIAQVITEYPANAANMLKK